MIWGEQVRYFASDCHRVDLPPATNAYGAQYNIEPTSQSVIAVADATPRKLEWPTELELQMRGAEARTLVPNLIVRFIGTLADWKPGVAVACGSKRDGPTSDSPYDRRINRRLYNGRIERVELIDTRSGQVLQSTSRPAD